jgi:hypothetical protein
MTVTSVRVRTRIGEVPPCFADTLSARPDNKVNVGSQRRSDDPWAVPNRGVLLQCLTEEATLDALQRQPEQRGDVWALTRWGMVGGLLRLLVFAFRFLSCLMA